MTTAALAAAGGRTTARPPLAATPRRVLPGVLLGVLWPCVSSLLATFAARAACLASWARPSLLLVLWTGRPPRKVAIICVAKRHRAFYPAGEVAKKMPGAYLFLLSVLCFSA
jgi:hypothetical protein